MSPDKQVLFLSPLELINRLDKLAKEVGINRSELIRMAIEDLLDNPPRKVKRLTAKGLRRTPRIRELEGMIISMLKTHGGALTGEEMWRKSLREPYIPGMQMVRWNMRRLGILTRDEGAKGKWRIA